MGDTPSALDRLKEHHKSLGVATVDVPEMGVVVYYTPMTLQERQKINKAETLEDKLLDAIILKAMDEQGEPLFTIRDKPELRRFAAADVLDRLGFALIGGAGFEDAVKN